MSALGLRGKSCLSVAARRRLFLEERGWQAVQDSNLDKQNQNLLCYHYTNGLACSPVKERDLI